MAAAAGAEFEQPVGVAQVVRVVFDDDDGVAGVAQPEEQVEEFLNVIPVQAGGGLVEEVEAAALLAFAEFVGELEPLRLAVGKRVGGLAELEVAEAGTTSVRSLPTMRAWCLKNSRRRRW